MFVMYHTFYFNHGFLVIILLILQGCINYGHLVWYITNSCFFLNCMHIFEIPLSVWTTLYITRSLTFLSFYMFSLFIIFTMIFRHVPVLCFCKLQRCITFKVYSLVSILRIVSRIISKISVGLKVFSSSFKVISSFTLPFRYTFSFIFSLFLT